MLKFRLILWRLYQKKNYLKAIYGLAKVNGTIVPSSILAKELGVSNAAITEMVKKLDKNGYVDYQKYKGIKILAKGRRLAVNVLRKHRLWELFLIKTLGLDWGEVHPEAENLEHCTTDVLIDRIDEFLNYPVLDPHGAPIPNRDGIYRSETNDIPMYECSVGERYRISRVNDRNPELIKYLSQIKISLNKKIKIVDKLSFDNSVIIEIDKIRHSLSEKLVNNIYLSEIEG